ncbi:peptide chain release factor N(5)-glutamine methyltransferase [Cohnella boryungensis]|uniref:Release factor glutamine methyltransferase n=1 Tax=Cohnella boryungensis TaxID=768479 RepID=A0ABV8S894_9BACL
MSVERETGVGSLGELWRRGAAQLRQAGVEEANADAELLLLYLLGIGKSALLRDWREAFPAGKSEDWQALLARRASGIPVQYVIGEQYFYGRAFKVTEAVLIPRPETELLAEAVLEAADRIWPGSGNSAPVVLDVGTGSGALAVTLAAERPDWQVVASDLSDEALQVARSNAQSHGADARIAFIQGDLLSPFLRGSSHELAVDVLVSNPPYIPSADIPGLQREVRDHEPRLALDGGDDGLDPYRAMAGQLPLLPRLPRIVAWEVGAGQAPEAAELLRAVADWGDVRFVKDYAGIDRHVVAVK